MFFKKLFCFFLLSVLSLALVSCGLSIGETPQPEATVENKSSACLDESLKTLSQMLKSEFYNPSDDLKISDSLTCINQVVRDFSRLVHGADSQHFTQEEIVYFVNKNFLKNKTPVSKSLIAEILKLKKSLLGGDSNIITKSELNQLQLIIDELKPRLVELNKHMPIVNQKWDLKSLTDDVKQEKFIQAQTAFNNLALYLSSQFRDGYDLQNLDLLISELFNMGWIGSGWSKNDFQLYIQAVINLKQLLTSSPSSLLTAQEIHEFSPLMAQFYFHYLDYKFNLSSVKYSDPAYSKQLLKLLPEVRNTLSLTLNLNTKGYLETDFIVQAYSSLYRALNKPEPINPNSVRSLLRSLWTNLLNNPEDRLQQIVLPGFNHQALDRLYNYVSQLFLSDSLSSELFIDQSFFSQQDFLKHIQSRIDQSSAADHKKMLTEIKSMVNSPAPLTTSKYFLKILDPSSSIYNYQDLQLSNLARVATRLVTQSYAHSLETVQNSEKLSSQLSLVELEMAFNQFKNILVELDLLTANTSTFMSSRFQESNLFLSRSNGDQWMSFYEAHDLILHLISGTIRAQKIRPYIVQNCLSSLKVAVRSTDEVDEACLLDTYYKHNEGFDFLPQYQLFKSQTSPQKAKDYFKNLLIGGGYVVNDRNKVLMEDADRFPHVIQYVEMLFSLYDINRDGKIVKDEALKAFPVFKELIKKAVASIDDGGSVKESELPGVFIYFLKYGRAPDGWLEKIQFKLFISSERNWTIESTRYELGAVFKSLANY